MTGKTEPTMSVSGRIIEIFSDGLATFKVQTRYGFALVWVYEEIEVNFRIGADFNIDEAPVAFAEGYVIAIVKPGNCFFLNGTRYETAITKE